MYLEIEHKYVVDESFDRQAFEELAKSMGPVNHYHVEVSDTYFLARSAPHHVFRHRKDRLIEELTVKSIGHKDNERRFEVNLPIKGAESGSVEAFLTPLGVFWKGNLKKNVYVYEFPTIEVVYYEAESAAAKIRCVEVEAIGFNDSDAALAEIARVEKHFGLDVGSREKKSLLQLLFPEVVLAGS